MSVPYPLTQFLLLFAWPCGIVYLNRTFGLDAWHPQRPAILEDVIIYRYLSWLLFFSLARFF